MDAPPAADQAARGGKRPLWSRAAAAVITAARIGWSSACLCLHVIGRRRKAREMEGGEQGGERRGAKRAEEAEGGGRSDGGGEERRPAKGRFRPGLGLQLGMENQRTSVLHRVVSFAPDPLPARQYDIRTTEPISFYLSGLEELLSWKPTSDDAFNVSMEPLAKRKPLLDSNRPRTLVCHDMKGGYLEDRFIQGSEVCDPFVFYHWCYIDIFVYFSHHTVTIPPVVWTNAAHRNGVLMLGTFITEWINGAKICESFLAGEEEAYRSVAEQLAAIAQFYRFDGWLVNIENHLSETAAQNMPHFLRYLTDRVHQAVPGGKVVWYDSVLKSGELKWQNELNDNNQVYFDACDGFFTNYNWKEEQLLQTREMAGERRCDVYVGVDVFGRGDVVSGGFDSNKSLSLIRHHGLSVAIFAPGWVYEQLGPTDFLHNENKFWGLLSEWLSTHSIGSLPFGTSFSLGMGKKHFSNGQENGTKPWYHLSAQEAQPLYTSLRQPSGGWLRTRCCLQDAWCGGSSLMLEGALPPSANHVTASWFIPRNKFVYRVNQDDPAQGPQPLRPILTFPGPAESLHASGSPEKRWLFSFQMPAPRRLYLVLIYKHEGPSGAVTIAPEVTTQESHTCYNLDVSTQPEPTRHKPSLLLTPPSHLAQLMRGCGQPGDPGWQGRCYELELQNCVLNELLVAVSRRHRGQDEVPFAYRLGEIWVMDAAHLRSPLPTAAGGPVSSIEVAHVQWHRPSSEELSVSLTLRWTCPPSEAKCFRVHYRRGSCVADPEPPLLQIGEAHVPLYRVTDLRVPDAHAEASCHLEFLVEPVPHDGFQVADALWGKLLFVYSNPKLPSTGGSPNAR